MRFGKTIPGVAVWAWASMLAASAQDIPLADDPIVPGTSEGKASFVPYESSWYPATEDVMLQALREFSEYIKAKHGFDPRLDGLEKFRHYVAEGSPLGKAYDKRGIPISQRQWFGHCNGSSAAACQVKEPPAEGTTREAGQRTFRFSQDTLKAIGAEVYYGASALSVGTRSNLKEIQFTQAKKLIDEGGTFDQWKAWFKDVYRTDPPSTFDLSDFKIEAERELKRFEDISPLKFDQVLRTVIERAKLPLVVEITPGYEVWNYPEYGFSFSRKVTVQGGRLAQGERVFDVTSTIETTGHGKETYTYQLTADGEGRPKGEGRWTGESVTNHPDFNWIPIDPRFRLPEVMAEAFTNYLFMKHTQGEILNAVVGRDRTALQRIRETIREVANEVASPQLTTPEKLTKQVYDLTVRKLRGFATNFWLQQTYGQNAEYYLSQQLSERFARGKTNLDLVKDFWEILPPGSRLVDDVERRLREAAGIVPWGPASRSSLWKPVAREAAGWGQFAAAYLLKEAISGRNALGELKSPGFWGSLAAFTVAAGGTKSMIRWIPKAAQGLSRATLPLAAGIAAVQFFAGQLSPENLLLSTGAFVVAGTAISAIVDPLLVFSGPLGWTLGAAKLVGILFAADFIEGKIRGRWWKDSAGTQESVQKKVEAVGSTLN